MRHDKLLRQSMEDMELLDLLKEQLGRRERGQNTDIVRQ